MYSKIKNRFLIIINKGEQEIMNELNIDNQSNQPSQNLPNKTVVGVMIAISIVLMLLAVIISSVGGSNGYLTYENYLNIHNGMTYNEVVEVLDGHQGELNTSAGYGGYSLSYYTWSNNSGSRCIVIGFENGRVCAKSQYGLN